MKYNEMLARSFSPHLPKTIKHGALIGCIIAILCLCTIFKSYLCSLPPLSLRLAKGNDLQLLIVSDETSEAQKSYFDVKNTKLICNTSKTTSDICAITNGDVRIQGNSSTIFVLSSQIRNDSWTIKPYARKGDKHAMKNIKNFTIKAVHKQDQLFANIIPNCTKTHNVQAIVFSINGYAGNHFHAFSDVIIPLYATSREFDTKVQFLLSDKRSSWTNKFRVILENLSKYEIINIDKESEVHCFPSMIVGLKKERKELSIDPSISPYSMKDFKSFLRSSYSLDKETAIKLREGMTIRPRIFIISRKGTRAFMNEGEIINGAHEAGFEVIMTDTSLNLTFVSRVINSCDVMMGIHGAGLTNMVFLPENAIFIQIVPWGGMQWTADKTFGEPSKDMGLKYLEYKISENESSLTDQYPIDHQVFKDPFSIHKGDWTAFKKFYMDRSVKLDMARFKETLLKAVEFLHD